MEKTAVLLINLGTPDSPTTVDVRKYLRQFLMDPFVVDIAAHARWFLVNAIILPTRPQKSAELYRKVWTARGSPLLSHTVDLARKLGASLGASYVVEAGMRYGKPSIESALGKLLATKPDRLLVLPLYPQYSLAATESSIVEFRRVLQESGSTVPWQILSDFYDDPRFIEAFSQIARDFLADKPYDELIFSFHGLPERQVKKTDPTGAHCLASDTCCAKMTEANRRCYRAQSYQTAHLIARKLDLPPSRYAVGFQSRLGRTPWIKPYTDFMYDEFAKRGVKRLAVMSPSFVADCLETLEEIAIRGREQFRAAGGEELYLVPSLNSSDAWVSALGQMIRGQNPLPSSVPR